MASLSWLRLARRVTGVVHQKELPNLEALLDSEAEHRPGHDLFVLSCAIPSGIALFGAATVFVAWLAGNAGLPLILGSILTAALAGAAFFVFFRMYLAVSPSKRKLHGLILKFAQKYSSFGNTILGEQALSDQLAPLIDEAAAIYLRHSSETTTEAPVKAQKAIEEAMIRLMEAANLKESEAQNLALVWAEPMVEEMRRLDQTLTEAAKASKQSALADPLANLREARAEIETSNTAIQELDDHLGTR